jgi:RNA polymerase sigma factor for flagellar operon FliA
MAPHSPKTEAVASAAAEVAVCVLWERLSRSPRDEDCVSELMDHYVPLVVRVVRRLALRFHGAVDPRELLGAGTVGLRDAILRFSSERGECFEAFAEHRIRGAVLDDMRACDPLSRRQRSALRRLQKVREGLLQELEREPSVRELSEAAHLPPARVGALLDLDAGPVPLDTELEGGTSLAELIADPHAETPREIAEVRSDRALVAEMICSLSDREQQVLFFRYYEELSVREIATVFGVTSGRVSQMVQAAVAHLRTLVRREAVAGLGRDCAPAAAESVACVSQGGRRRG